MQRSSFQGIPAAWPWAVASAAALRLLNDALHLPFDAARWQHAWAVQAGLLASSMLESRDFERAIDALEQIALGPFARHV